MLGKMIERAWPGLAFQDYISQVEAQRFSFAGVEYLAGGTVSEMSALQGQRNPIVGTCVSIRASVFSEIRFAWQPFEATRAGIPFGNPSLRILEKPWAGGNTGDLLTRMEVDLSFYGNSYWTVQAGELVRLDPTRTYIVSGDVAGPTGLSIGRRLLGYQVVDDDGVSEFLPGEVAHYKAKPSVDEKNPYAGVSWLGEVLPDVEIDWQMTEFKKSFVRNGAVPGLVAIYPAGVGKDQVDAVAEMVDGKHTGVRNAFKTIHIGGGADVKTVGADMRQLDLKPLQGAGETRIAAAAGVAPVVASLSEGLQGSQLNAGNYVAARRRFADITIRPLWRAACGALQTIIPPPDGLTRLWYEDRDVSFLQEDVKDAAEIRFRDAQSMRQLIDTGFDPETVIDAVVSGDFTKLEHTGKVSVQLRPPGEGEPSDDTTD